jgi:Ca-activated chloride channel family protein
MSFVHPYLFFLLIIPFISFVYLVLTNKDGVERVFSKKVLERIKVEGGGLSNRGRNILFFLAIFMMIVAISHPYILKGDKNIKLEGLNIALALDISSSMRSKDRYPNRLEFAKQKIKVLLDELPEDEITIYAFNNDVYLVSPSSSDKETLKQVIDGILSKRLNGYADFKTVALVLKDKLSKFSDKIAIIVSDGTSKKGLDTFERIIKKNNIKLYVILTSTKKGAPLLDKDEKVVLKNDRVVMSYLDETLGKIAKESGGDYIIAGYKDSDINYIVNKIKNSFIKRNSGKTIHVIDRVELFYYPLVFAFLFLVAAFSSFPNKKIFTFKLPKFRRDK